MSEWKWTQSEQQALIVSLQHFGPCRCRPAQHGHLASICDGHSFLSETDRRVDRTQHMLYVRRTRQDWLNSEWMGTEPPRDEISPPVLPEAVRSTVTVDPEPVEPSPPDQLPW